jgi:hypothetical protein
MVFCVIVIVMNVPEALRHPIETTRATPPGVVAGLALCAIGDVLATGDFLMGGKSVLAYASEAIIFTGYGSMGVLQEQVRRERQTQGTSTLSMENQ